MVNRGDADSLKIFVCCFGPQARGTGDAQVIRRALQLAFIVPAIAVIYPFAGYEPVLFPKPAAELEIFLPPKTDQSEVPKADKLPQVRRAEDEPTVTASLPHEQARTEEQVQRAEDEPTVTASLPHEQARTEEQVQPAEDEPIVTASLPREQARTEEDDHPFFQQPTADASSPKLDLAYLAYYAYSEVPPDQKPADTVRDALKDIPVGTPVEEIKRASDAFGIDFTFMKTVARIESDFDPKQRTGSYIGLFQLSNYEFDKYGSGSITDPRDNSIAAAYKFTTAAILFELQTHQKPSLSDLYLIHQQGTQGAAEHVSHPERVAWKSMCATDEGRQKGEKWCKRAIWQNTLPDIKRVWKSVENLTSGAFVAMWQQRVAQFYTRYSAAVSAK
jgi:hypothetical protein